MPIAKTSTSAPSPIIQAINLQKSYGDFQAVKGVSFKVRAGTCTGLLGPNGAGKTSTMKMLLGLSEITDGTLMVLGENAKTLSRKTREKIGLVPQEDNLDPDLTVAQNLDVYGRFFGMTKTERAQRAEKLLHFMHLTEKKDNRVNQLSGGMKRRLTIARALLANPDLVALDEPTTGLDPQGRAQVWQRVTDLKKQGKTVLLTTHYMDEAQRLCDDIILIDHGKILDEGTPKQLIKTHVPPHVFDVAKPLSETLQNWKGETEDLGESVLFYADDFKAFQKNLDEKTSYHHRPANLEDVFLRLTGRTLRE